MPLLQHPELSLAKGQLYNTSIVAHPPFDIKDMYRNKKQESILVSKLSLEDYNLYFFHYLLHKWSKERNEKANFKKQYKKTFSLTNSTTNSSQLCIFKSWTDHLYLKFGDLTFIPHQPDSEWEQSRYTPPIKRLHFMPAMPPTQPMSWPHLHMQ